MNMSFLLAGSASTNPVLFTMAIGLILAWKVAGYYGLDRILLPMLGTPWHPGVITGRETNSTRGSSRLTTAGPDGPRPVPPPPGPQPGGGALSCRTPPSRSAASSVAVDSRSVRRWRRS